MNPTEAASLKQKCIKAFLEKWLTEDCMYDDKRYSCHIGLIEVFCLRVCEQIQNGD